MNTPSGAGEAPQKGDLVTFKHEFTPEERGYVRRVFRSGNLTVERTHPGERGRRTFVEPREVLRVHKDERLHEQPTLGIM